MKKRILKNYRYRIANSRHKQYRSNLCKGSFTIEASCVMSIVLLTVMGVIYLSFFVHNRAWLTAAAHEAALVGCQEMRLPSGNPEQAAYERARTLLSPRLFGAENLQVQIEKQGKEMLVRFDADTVCAYGRRRWHLQTEAKEKYTDPVAFIWRLKGLEGIVH